MARKQTNRDIVLESALNYVSANGPSAAKDIAKAMHECRRPPGGVMPRELVNLMRASRMFVVAGSFKDGYSGTVALWSLAEI